MATLESLDQEEDLTTTSASSHLQTPNPPGEAAGKQQGWGWFRLCFQNPRKVGSFPKRIHKVGPYQL